MVASFTDAWIETMRRHYIDVLRGVASFTDAWIETYSEISGTPNLSVASFTDAWIETLSQALCSFRSVSHLLQMRGLKHAFRTWKVW